MMDYVTHVGIVPVELVEAYEKWLKPYGVRWPNPGQ